MWQHGAPPHGGPRPEGGFLAPYEHLPFSSCSPGAANAVPLRNDSPGNPLIRLIPMQTSPATSGSPTLAGYVPCPFLCAPTYLMPPKAVLRVKLREQMSEGMPRPKGGLMVTQPLKTLGTDTCPGDGKSTLQATPSSGAAFQPGACRQPATSNI